MKIRIENGTDWPTGEFRKLFLACAKHEGMDHAGTYTVELYYPRGGSGWGYYNRRHMKLALPNWDGFAEDRNRADDCCAIRLATTIIHEMGHNRGLKHKDMNGKAEAAAAREVCEALGMKVLHRETKAKRAKAAAPKPTAVEANEAKARDALDRLDALIEKEEKRHTKAMKALKTRRGKARSSVRYYDRKAADK